MESTNETPKGDMGRDAQRPRRDRDGRLIVRAFREQWAPDTERLNELRKKIEDIILNGNDPRASVLGYRALMESEAAIVNSTNQIAALEGSEAQTSEPKPEPIEPD